jgi:hypothetical protein
VRGLLTADAYRLRRRPEIWLLLIVIPLGAAFGFVTAYFAVPGHYFSSDPTVPIPEIAIEQAEYFFPSSLYRVLDDTTWVILAAFVLVATSVGAEFAWGTIRTALLARSDRGRLIASRLIAIALVGLLFVGLLLVVGTLMPVVLSALGEHQAADQPLQPDLAPFIGARLAAIAFTIGLAAFLTVLSRNAPMTILLGLIYVLAELLVGSNPSLHGSDATAAIVRCLPIASVVGLVGDASTPGGAVPTSPGSAYVVVVFPLWLSFAISVAWTAFLVGASITVIRRADISE